MQESHAFNVALATALGVNAAIIFSHIAFLQKNTVKSKEDYKEVWVTRSCRQLALTYPYLTAKMIRNAIDKLLSLGLIMADSSGGYDRSTSYRPTKRGFEVLENGPSYNMSNGQVLPLAPIDNKTNTPLALMANPLALMANPLAERANDISNSNSSYNNLNQSISASAQEKIETVEDIQEGIKEAVNLTLEEEKEKTPPCSAPPPSFTEGMPKTWKDLVRDAEPREIKYDKFTGERLFMIDTAAELAEALFKIKDHKIFCDNVRQAAQREANERIGDIFTEYLRRQLSITWDSIQVQKQLETHILNYARKYPFVEKRNQQLATELAEANKESKVKDISAADKWRKVVNEAA